MHAWGGSWTNETLPHWECSTGLMATGPWLYVRQNGVNYSSGLYLNLKYLNLAFLDMEGIVGTVSPQIHMLK